MGFSCEIFMVYLNLVIIEKGLTKCTPNEFVPSIIVDGLLMEKKLGVLIFFVLILQIPTYLGTRGVLFFYTEFFQHSNAGEYEFVFRIRPINTTNSC
jgi:hypothetical protein